MGSNQKMRVVHFTSNHFDFLAIPLANELSELTEFHLILSMFKQGSEKPAKDEPSALLNPSVNASFFIRNIRKRNPLQIVFDIRIFAKIVRFAPDIVLIEGVESPYFISFYPLMKLLGMHLVFLMHDVVPHSGSEKHVVEMFTRVGVHLSDGIIVFSEDQRRECQMRFGRDAHVVHLTHPVSYEQFYRQHSIQREPWTILFFGQVRPNKGLSILIQAAEMVRKTIPDLKVIIAGACDDFEFYQKLIKTPTMFELHLGTIPDREVGRYFLRSQCSVLPYLDATQSAVLLVSFAFNCPVIAADVGGLPEYLSVGETGLLFNRGNAIELAGRIVELLLNEKRLKYMQARTREVLLERYSAGVIAKEIVRALENTSTSE